MSRSSEIVGKIFTGIVIVYFVIAGLIFVPYYNWQYAKENGFVKWLFLGELVPTLKATVWPYFLYKQVYDEQGSGHGTSKQNVDLTPWPDPTDVERERINNIWTKAMTEPLTADDLDNYKIVMKDYSKRVNRNITAKDAHMFTDLFDVIYTFRYEYGKSLLASIDNKDPILTNAYEEATKFLLEARIIDRKTIEEQKENIKSAAKQAILTDSEGVKHYPTTREHVLEVMEKDKILKKNIDAIKKINFEIAAVR